MVSKMQVTWLNEDRRIRRRADHRASMKWTHEPPITSKARGLNITSVIQSRGEHPDRLIVIQRRQCKVFYNASHQTSSERSIHNPTAMTLFLKGSKMDHSIVTDKSESGRKSYVIVMV